MLKNVVSDAIWLIPVVYAKENKTAGTENFPSDGL